MGGLRGGGVDVGRYAMNKSFAGIKRLAGILMCKSGYKEQ